MKMTIPFLGGEGGGKGGGCQRKSKPWGRLRLLNYRLPRTVKN